MDVFEPIQQFIVSYKIELDTSNLDKINSEKTAIYNSIVTIMKNMTKDENGRIIIDIISSNINKIKENISMIKELPEVNLNYVAVDLLIFKSLLFIYYQMNKIPNFIGTFIENSIRLRDENINGRDDYSYFHSNPLRLFLVLKLNSAHIDFNKNSEWETIEGFKHTTGSIKSQHQLIDEKYGNLYDSLIGCTENTITGLHKGDINCQKIRDKMKTLHDYNVEEQILPVIGKINKTNRGYMDWYPDIDKESVVGVGNVPWYTPPTYFLSLLSTNINADGLLFTSRKFLINSKGEYMDFFLKITQIFSNYIIKAKFQLKEKYNGFSMPFAITRKNSGTHFILFSCDKDDFFYYSDVQNEGSLYMFKIIFGPDNSINIDTSKGSNPNQKSWFDRYMKRMNFTDKFQSEFEIDKDGNQTPNLNKDRGITGFEIFFWIDTYTENLNNTTEETMFDYISKISQNILYIESGKEFVKKDYVDALTFGGKRKKTKTKTMKKGKSRRKKTARGKKKNNKLK